ncbi:hypothetical protein CAPI_07005 [Corynebacterium capitovis DSM 44611]|uniref:DUF5997 family protein n=1 Tax=Corynebacterium capitovis TaxID=131081 RepID=UPI000365C592|nr:DUF5997 family protein [Corynebacterium capitovis]WKD57941.1 hypothetical protein CAPI_07005 [Corynebacterium capitovis DSM 44611]
MTDIKPSGTAMKPLTAAKKLGIDLASTPPEFQQGAVTHAELRELQDNPPEWLKNLRLNGPHPRNEVARKLGVTITALKKSGIDTPLTTQQIMELLSDQPEWLHAARAQLAEQRRDAADNEGSNRN